VRVPPEELACDQLDADGRGAAGAASRQEGRRRGPALHGRGLPVRRARARRHGHRQAVLRAHGGLGGDVSDRALQAGRLIALPARLVRVGPVRRPLRPGGELMLARRKLSVSGLTFAAAFAVAFALFGATTASARIATFVSTYCYVTPPESVSPLSRANALSLMASAQWEGYQWGGGCWNNNNI